MTRIDNTQVASLYANNQAQQQPQPQNEAKNAQPSSPDTNNAGPAVVVNLSKTAVQETKDTMETSEKRGETLAPEREKTAPAPQDNTGGVKAQAQKSPLVDLIA